MRRIYTYILALLALSVACQRVDLPVDSLVNQPAELPIGAIGSKATISFSTADVTGPETRGVVDSEVGVETLHLIVFDKNGMLVEVCKAEKGGSSDHDDHQGGSYYTVTLTLTDEPRIIHYVANCPVGQVEYGHETSVIGNMYVDRNGSEGAKTTYETSYWARIEVPYILVEEKEIDGTEVVSLVDEIKDKFRHVPLLRNYAMITVEDETDNTFLFEGFTVYNLLNRGTVAPYNSNTQKFQSFFTYTEGAISNYSYPKISKEFGYEGHALTSAKLITDFIRNDGKDEDGSIKFYNAGDPFYVYERKVSVMTDEEEKWRESPPHIIIMGRYNNGKSTYYKMDLVYTEKDGNGNEEIKYYNILRNFKYQFNITAIHDEGYASLDEAVAGAAGNNISGSSSTSKLTNVSDNEGRLWVSYTDTTLVSNDAIVFRYKYIPNYYDNTKPDYNKVDNGQVRFENYVGEVITGIVVADRDIEGGTWDGYREVTISVNEPTKITRQQILSLKTNSANLNRQIRYTLREKLTMQVEATPKVRGEIMKPVTVDIKLPIGMTEDMFPLKLDMETLNRTLSPDATQNSIPVTAGPSIIEDRKGELSYYYTVTIPTFDAYKALPNDGNMKEVTTHWLTNMAANASTFYVANKYFNQAYDSWENYKYEFSNATCTPSAVGVDKDVTISFTMDGTDNSFNRPVTISLKGMTYNGATEMTYTPSQKNVSLTCKTTTATDPVSFTLDADEYNIVGPVKGARLTYKFNGAFVGERSLAAEADVEVDFTFNISEDALNALKSLYPDAGDAGVPMYVTLDRMQPADDQLVYSQGSGESDRYIYRIKQAGTQTIKLATTEDTGGPCTVTLQADYFDTETKEINQIGREFRNLNITNNRIAQGLGRSVNITFQLANEDGNNAQKDVTVTLVNMTVNGKNTITFNTGDSNAVTNNNGTYTIKNVVTADDPAGELKVTITAKGYSSKEVTFTERPKPKFTASLNKTSLGTGANEEVVLSFSSEDLVDGMDVTLELDGLRPKEDLPTRAVTRYVYTVNGTGTQEITLVTTESTTTSKTCYVQLKAEEFGFEDSQILSVVQSNAVTYSGTNKNVTYSINRPEVSGGNWWDYSTYSATINSIKVNDTPVDYTGSAAYTYSNNNPGTLTITLNSISITGIDLSTSTEIEFDCTITVYDWWGTATGTTTAKFIKTIEELGLTLSN